MERTRGSAVATGTAMVISWLTGTGVKSKAIAMGWMLHTKLRCKQHNRQHASPLVLSGLSELLSRLASKQKALAFEKPVPISCRWVIKTRLAWATRQNSRTALANGLDRLALKYSPNFFKSGILFDCGVDNQLNKKLLVPSMGERGPVPNAVEFRLYPWMTVCTKFLTGSFYRVINLLVIIIHRSSNEPISCKASRCGNRDSRCGYRADHGHDRPTDSPPGRATSYHHD